MAPLTLSTTNPCRRRSVKGTASLQSLVVREISSILDMSSEVIDLNAGFVELGGHSLFAIDLASTCKSQNIHLSVENILLSDTIADVLDSAKWTPPNGQSTHQRSKICLSLQSLRCVVLSNVRPNQPQAH